MRNRAAVRSRLGAVAAGLAALVLGAALVGCTPDEDECFGPPQELPDCYPELQPTSSALER